MRKKRFKNQEEFYSEAERQWLKTARPESKASAAINTIIFVVVLAALFVAAYLNRARIGTLWQQMTGKAPPTWLMPEKPEREGPEIEGRDFQPRGRLLCHQPAQRGKPQIPNSKSQA